MARPTASRKRKSDVLNSQGSDEADNIKVVNPWTIARSNKPLKEVEPSQASNKRRRELDYVLVEENSKVDAPAQLSTSQNEAPSALQDFLQGTSMDDGEDQDSEQGDGQADVARESNMDLALQIDSSEEVSNSQNGRPRRVAARRSLAKTRVVEDDSDDELAAAAAKPMSRKRVKRKADAESSDFEDSKSASESDPEEFQDNAASESDSSAESVEDISDVEVEKPKPKRGAVRPKQPAKAASKPNGKSATGKSATGKSSKGSSNNMKKLLNRAKGEAKGLDPGLAPLHDIRDIFADITSKGLDFGLRKVVDHLRGRPLRVATMCSGTESPILATQMIREALTAQSEGGLEVEHLFSAEIEPFKQAYIERNFNPPIIFRDITELTDAVHEEVPMATTAYGARVTIPTNADLVIAGTSCVDFSRLNKYKKGLNDGGESDKTWHAVLAFCKAFRPAIVLLENVKSADWDLMLEHYEEAGYEAAGALVDTKNFYIPHTRQRGYIVCFDKGRLGEAGIKSAGALWQDAMDKFKRYASSPVSSFLLPNDKVTERNQTRGDDPSRDVDWSTCEVTQMRYRQDTRLGNARPFTHWQESGAMIVPENGSASWYHGQVERVLDTIDAASLRKALPSNGMYDVRYKTRIWDLSQNIYMNTDAAAFGITGCITPSGQFFISDAGRALTSEENLKLQGLPLDKMSFTTENAKELQDLAGNAMSTTVVGPAIVGALIAGFKMFTPTEDGDTKMITEDSLIRDVKLTADSMEVVHMSSGEESVEVAQLLTEAHRAMRKCCCESSMGMTPKPLQRCADCGHTTCIVCGGNPKHNYVYAPELSKDRIQPRDFEARLMTCLSLRMRHDDLDHIDDFMSAHGSPKVAKYVAEIKKLGGAEFTLSHVRRTHCITVTYLASVGRLELILKNGAGEWRLFVNSPKHLASNDWLRQTLVQPVAKAAVVDSKFSALAGAGWIWRVPSKREIALKIKGHGARMPTWWSRNEMPDFKEHRQWQYLDVELKNGNDAEHMEAPVEGTYAYLPQCGTSCDSLYKRIDAGEGELPMFLFQDPTRVGDPKQDPFVFCSDKSLLEYDEIRCTFAHIQPSWRPWEQKQSECSATLVVESTWLRTAADEIMRPLHSSLEISRPKDVHATTEMVTCEEAVAVIGCQAASNDEMLDHEAGQAIIIQPDDIAFFDTNAWVFEAMRRELTSGQWHQLKNASASLRCYECAPVKPSLKWRLGEDGKTIAPYEDPASAAEYERAIKRRPIAMFVETRTEPLSISLGVNLVSLAHRARARLALASSEANFSWTLTTNSQSAGDFSPKPFRLSNVESMPPHDSDLKMSIELFPKQRLSLAWMRRQESGDGQSFILEEAEEASLSRLGWRVEMRAQSNVRVRGGICADHPGFGKTITSLALIQAQMLETPASNILAQMKERGSANAEGFMASSATVIVCPGTLVEQWMGEIKDKLRLRDGVYAIKTDRDLARLSVQEFATAKIIVVTRSLFSTEAYAERLASFTAVPGPATNKGRSFAQWLKFATTQIPEHLRILRESGRKELRKHISEQYKINVNSDEFKAFVPSRRLRGKDYAEGKKKTAVGPAKAASSSIDAETAGTPLFEMFYFNRLIVDEFHEYEPREYAAITSLKADKRWGLSATPALGDFYDIAQMAGMLGIPLRIGSDARGVMKIANVRELRKDMTDFERFDSMRQAPSNFLHTRIQEIDQMFLDSFVRRSIADFANTKYQDHLVPVSLDLDHRALYTELSQHLNSLDMRIRKGNKSKNTDREEFLYEAVVDCSSAEEALSKQAVFFDRSKYGSGLESFVRRREREVQQCHKKLRDAIADAKSKEPEHFASWKSNRVDTDVLGDEETVTTLRTICEENGGQTKASATKKQKATIDDELDEDDGDKKAGGGRGKDSARALTSKANGLVNRLLVSNRSLRFLKNVQLVQQSTTQGSVGHACDSPTCQSEVSQQQDVAVSALCGHMICASCFKHHQEDLHHTHCPAGGCSSSMRAHHILWKQKMGDLKEASSTPQGAKVCAAMHLLEKIQKQGDQAILFVQYAEQLDQVASALSESDISSVIVRDTNNAGQQIAAFRDSATDKKQSERSTVIVLNASDETAAGSNLQNANHVIFLSPLLRDSQYGYEATMAQAVGRVRRHGQKKEVHVYRIVALDTIDVDILEHREHRSDALTESGAAVVAAPQGLEHANGDADKPGERTQLVREGGKFSLRPHSWLVKSGAEGEGLDERVKGKSRVLGWEDFSSLVKFSKAYTEDDD